MKRISVISILIVALLFSCASKKAIYESSSSVDYNLRKTYQKPQYKYKINMIGWTTAVSAAAAGGYYGYKSNLNYFKTNEVNESPIMDATLGALLGFGVVHLGNYLFAKKDKIVPLNYNNLNEYDWLKNHNRNEILLSHKKNEIESINERAIDHFSIRTLNDAYDFAKAFPGSSKYNDILAKDHQNLERSDLPRLISLFPDYKNLNDLKVRYLGESDDINSLLLAEKKYPETGYDIEKKAVMLTSSFDDLVLFNERFPKSSFTQSLIDKNYKRYSHAELGKLIELFPSSIYSEIKREYILSSSSIDELFRTSDKFEGILSEEELKEEGFDRIESRNSAKAFYDKFKTSSYVAVIKNPFPSYYQSTAYDTYYIGPTNKGKANGYGYVIAVDESSFFARGEFKNGEPHGHINLQDENYSFIGNYSNGKRNGEGKLEMDDRTYEGGWHDGLKSGFGIEKYTTRKGKKVTDMGNFYKGEMHGQGKRSFSDGTWIEGNFNNGRPEGELLEMRTPEGHRIKGEWVNGYPVGTHKVKKWTLFGLLDTYEGTVTWGEKGEIASQTTDFDFWNQSTTGSGEANNYYEVITGSDIRISYEHRSYTGLYVGTSAILGSDICATDNSFSVTLTANNGYEQSSDDWLDTHFELFAENFYFPYTLTATYRKSCGSDLQIVKIKIYEPAFYSIDLD